MVERLTESIMVEYVSLKSSGNGNAVLKLLTENYSQGTSPEECILNLWLEHLRGKIPVETLNSVLNAFVDSLPESLQDRLTRPSDERDFKTPLIMVAEKARRQAEGERKAAMVQNKQIEKPPEKRKKPSKGMAKHIRRVKAAKRRSGVLPKH